MPLILAARASSIVRLRSKYFTTALYHTTQDIIVSDMHDEAKHEGISKAVSDLIRKTSDSLTSDRLKLLLQRNNLVECLRGVSRYRCFTLAL